MYQRKTKLPPELQDPIILLWEPGRPGREDLDRVQERYVEQERLRKLRLLAEYYGLNPDDSASWPRFSMKLACDTIPGMKTADSPRGRPKKRDNATLLRLYGQIEEVRRASGSRRITEACKTFAKKAKRSWGDHPPSYFEARYHEARKLLEASDPASVNELSRRLFG